MAAPVALHLTGDRAVLSEDEFVRLYPRLRAFARVIADADMDANDLVHDALVAVLQVRSGPIDNVEGYLRRTMLNRVRTHRRQAGGRSRMRLVVEQDTPTGTSPQYPSEVGALLEAVGPHDRAVLYLLDVEGLSVGEVGSIVGASDVAVRSRASRARRRLRRQIEEEQRGD